MIQIKSCNTHQTIKENGELPSFDFDVRSNLNKRPRTRFLQDRKEQQGDAETSQATNQKQVCLGLEWRFAISVTRRFLDTDLQGT